MKYLIIGLGNIGEEYVETRHNIGFMVLDKVAGDSKFTTERYAQKAEIKYKGRTIILIKPTTYMNLSGKAVRYWMDNEKVDIENTLVVTDDIALDLGTLRLKKKGSSGGHNGLTNIIETLGTSDFTRLRFGIGADFSKGRQVDFVLSKFSKQDMEILNPRIDIAADIIKSFTTIGVDQTMNLFNNK